MAHWNYKINAKIENIDDAVDFIRSKLNRISASCRNAVLAASCEILTNIASYAYTYEGGEIYIELSMDNKSIRVVFMDKGKPFNPDTVKDTEAADGKGMGIFIARNMMDTYNYKYKDLTNISIIEKRK